MPQILNIRLEALRKQVDTVAKLVAEPVGVFQTVDTMIRTFREANRKTLEAIRPGARVEKREGILRGRLLRR